MIGNEQAFGRNPIYAVVFRATSQDSPYVPLVGQYSANSPVTVPHGFDREVVAALPGLWYCQHLPNTFWELGHVSAAFIKAAQALHLDHHIVLAPVEILDHEHLGQRLTRGVPVLAVCPDDLLDEASQRSEALGFALPPAAYSQLSSDSLRAHWRDIHALLVPEVAYLGHVPALTQRLDLAPVRLPERWLTRQFGWSGDSPLVAGDGHDHFVAQALWAQTVLAATARLEREHPAPSVPDQRLLELIEEERVRIRCPVVLALPGVAPAYARGAYDRSLLDRIEPFAAVDEADTWPATMHQRSDTLVERAAIELVTTHRAVAQGGIGLVLPSVPPEAFVLLAQLERHCEAPRPRAAVVWRLLDRLDAVTKHLWSDGLAALVARASTLTVFSNFPFGLLRLPGDSSPLSARVPIAYRPLLPLTRTVQAELTYVPQLDLSTRLRVLVAECIPAEDPVGAASRAAWGVAAEDIDAATVEMTLEVVETLSVGSFRTAIADATPDILIISAHGALSKHPNMAGLRIGDEFLLGPGLGPLPPVVILSACHVAPRGAGTVSITEMLLNEGAVAVLGTQVPIDVQHNALLMVRFLLYIREALSRREEHSSLLEVWHRVQTSNAVNDVLGGSRSLRAWATSATASGRSVIEEFMIAESAGRLRTGRIYDDTEYVLGEIADNQGNGARVRNWFERPGYVPESLFYVFAGRPERVYLRPLDETVNDKLSRFDRSP